MLHGSNTINKFSLRILFTSVVDDQGQLLVHLFKNVLSEQLLTEMEMEIGKYKQPPDITDVRGKHATLKFGTYLERGGAAGIITRLSYQHCRGFLSVVDKVGTIANDFYGYLCPEDAYYVAKFVPDAFKLWACLILLFWNATTVNKVHKDCRDRTWCLVIPFGKFTGVFVDLPYLNTRVAAEWWNSSCIESDSNPAARVPHK